MRTTITNPSRNLTIISILFVGLICFLVPETSYAQDGSGNVVRLNTYPNPIVDAGTITFSADQNTTGAVEIYNMLGHKVATVFSGTITATTEQQVQWDGGLEPGTYMIQFRTNNGGNKVVKKILVVK